MLLQLAVVAIDPIASWNFPVAGKLGPSQSDIPARLTGVRSTSRSGTSRIMRIRPNRQSAALLLGRQTCLGPRSLARIIPATAIRTSPRENLDRNRKNKLTACRFRQAICLPCFAVGLAGLLTHAILYRGKGTNFR